MKTNAFSQDNPRASRNPWVIGWIALIVIVLGVNATMITLAYTTNPGLVSEDYYERGRDHEKHISDKLAARAALGWTITSQIPDQLVMQRNEKFRFISVDRAGLPLSEAKVIVHAYRPSDARRDFQVAMAESNPGFYEGDINFPLKGLWVLTVHVQKDKDVYNFTRRISVHAQ